MPPPNPHSSLWGKGYVWRAVSILEEISFLVCECPWPQWSVYSAQDSTPLSCAYLRVLSHIQFFATPSTAAHQAPLSMGFARQEFWRRLPFPMPEDLPDPGIEPVSLVSACFGRRIPYQLCHLGSPQSKGYDPHLIDKELRCKGSWHYISYSNTLSPETYISIGDGLYWRAT